MGKRILLGVLITALVLFLGVPGFAQESTVKGNLAGVVIDASGAIVAPSSAPNLSVTYAQAAQNYISDLITLLIGSPEFQQR